MVTWIPSIYPIYVSIYTKPMDPMDPMFLGTFEHFWSPAARGTARPPRLMPAKPAWPATRAVRPPVRSSARSL